MTTSPEVREAMAAQPPPSFHLLKLGGLGCSRYALGQDEGLALQLDQVEYDEDVDEECLEFDADDIPEDANDANAQYTSSEFSAFTRNYEKG